MERSLAYLVGSMEGPDSGGDYRDSGQLMYFLAKKKNCFAFNTCAANSNSKFFSLIVGCNEATYAYLTSTLIENDKKWMFSTDVQPPPSNARSR
jgi:hypothetical protein